ncbi:MULTISPECIES: hypothetical protein [unclassified Leisingera]|uniref:hypothetical protein n=1 Tax=unclassified Leisingera TaxID=2614906 RepID=UPI00037E26A8|nr:MULTISPECIES: hypothetical protein [unclassified Leisingera]KIC55090.1 hypothetical protein RA22_03265 [Leisingera sp. ANG-S]KID08395.1 hypothetical protein GC1_14670 [Leisingera sp. ANG1]
MSTKVQSISIASIFQRCIGLATNEAVCIGLAKQLAEAAPLRSTRFDQGTGDIASALRISDEQNKLRMGLAMYLTERYIHQHADSLHIVDSNRETKLLGANILTPTSGQEFAPIEFKPRSSETAEPTSMQLAKEELLSRVRNRGNLYAYLDTSDWNIRGLEEFTEAEPPIDGIHFVRQLMEYPRFAVCVGVSRKPSDPQLLKLLQYGTMHETFLQALDYVNSSDETVYQDELAKHLSRNKKNWAFKNVWELLQESKANIPEHPGRPPKKN